jgi:hypothetical protein
MAIGKNMPTGTKVKDASGKTGTTQAYLKNMQPAGGYKVRWDDDSSETEVRINLLELASGVVTQADYNAAVSRVVTRLGGITETDEQPWLVNNKLVNSKLVVARPAYLSAGQEMHAHVSPAGGMRRAHVKSGQNQVRVIYDNGGFTAAATADDQRWIADYKLRNSLKNSKQDYLDSKLELPA